MLGFVGGHGRCLVRVKEIGLIMDEMRRETVLSESKVEDRNEKVMRQKINK